MTERSLREWSVDRWIGIAGLAVAVLFGVLGILLVGEARDSLEKGFQAYGLKVLLWFACIVLLGFIFAALWRTRGLRNTEGRCRELTSSNAALETELSRVTSERDEAFSELAKVRQQLSQSIPYPEDKRGRWESLAEVRFGHVPYPPFLNYEKGNPVGIGVEVLSHLLDFPVNGRSIELQADDVQRDWASVLEGLIKRDYDVIATPLFATFDRSKQVGFTAPLFFSNIGLYVRKDIAAMPVWKDMTVDSLRDKLQQAAVKLTFLSVEGEISQKLANEYADSRSIENLPGRTILKNLFDRVANPNNPPYALFCESFYAHDQAKVVSKDVVNVMPQHQILYPVCFAIRIGDYQLKNLLNIRLLEMTRCGGVLDLLTKTCASSDEVKQHFIAKWPSATDATSAAHV